MFEGLFYDWGTLILFGFLLFIVVILLGVMFICYSKLGPVREYLWASFKDQDLLMVIDHTERISLKRAKYSTRMFDVEKPPWSYIQRIDKSYQLGTVRCVICSDGWGVTIDPEMLAALDTLAESGYINYDQIIEGMEKGELDPSDTIFSRAFTSVSLHNILNYVAEVTPSEIRAHLEEKTAEIAQQHDYLRPQGVGSNPMMLVMGIGILVVIGLYVVLNAG